MSEVELIAIFRCSSCTQVHVEYFERSLWEDFTPEPPSDWVTYPLRCPKCHKEGA